MRFAILLCMFSFVGCSKNTVFDQAPLFSLASEDLKSLDIKSAEVSLDRDTPLSGPTFQIQVEKWGDVKETQKSLLCGSFVIIGKMAQAPNASVLSFKFSDWEFPGLNTLPIHAQCKLKISLRNQLGSVLEREFPIKLNFNKHQKLNITRMTARTGGYIQLNRSRVLPLERYAIQNDFDYSLGFTYLGREFFCTGVVLEPQLGVIQAAAEKITLKGKYDFLAGDYFSFLSFSVPPKSSAQLDVFAMIATDVVERFPFNTCAQPTQVSSLTVWKDLKTTYDEKENPLRISLPPEGLQPLPEWRKTGT